MSTIARGARNAIAVQVRAKIGARDRCGGQKCDIRMAAKWWRRARSLKSAIHEEGISDSVKERFDSYSAVVAGRQSCALPHKIPALALPSFLSHTPEHEQATSPIFRPIMNRFSAFSDQRAL